MAEAQYKNVRYNSPGCSRSPELISKQLEMYVRLRYGEDKI